MSRDANQVRSCPRVLQRAQSLIRFGLFALGASAFGASRPNQRLEEFGRIDASDSCSQYSWNITVTLSDHAAPGRSERKTSVGAERPTSTHLRVRPRSLQNVHAFGGQSSALTLFNFRHGAKNAGLAIKSLLSPSNGPASGRRKAARTTEGASNHGGEKTKFLCPTKPNQTLTATPFPPPPSLPGPDPDSDSQPLSETPTHAH